MAYPPNWMAATGDPGTATAILLGSHHQYLGYLNLTPRQGAEMPGTWGRFRLEHNSDEGDRNVQALAFGTGLRFRSGAGTCVRDAYNSTTGVRFVELACLVSGRDGATVVVGASTPRAWARIAPLLERSLASMTT